MKTIIHVNQHNIKHNGKCCEAAGKKPVLTVKDYKTNRLGNTATILLDGAEVARVVYRPDKPLSCGARVWIETDCEVMVDDLVADVRPGATNPYNLDDPNEREKFLWLMETVDSVRQRARLLGFVGKGAHGRVVNLEWYARVKGSATQFRLGGNTDAALYEERICERIFKRGIQPAGDGW